MFKKYYKNNDNLIAVSELAVCQPFVNPLLPMENIYELKVYKRGGFCNYLGELQEEIIGDLPFIKKWLQDRKFKKISKPRLEVA